jgi:hypothetical protein
MKRVQAIAIGILLTLTHHSWCQKSPQQSQDLLSQLSLGSMAYANQDWSLVTDGAIKRGFAEGISTSISSFFDQIFGPAIKRGSHLARVCGKTIMHALHGKHGFDVREPINFSYMLKRDMETIDETANGARVVRAHVLDNDESLQTATNKKMPHGIVMLKQNAHYITTALQQRIPYYEQTFNTQQGLTSKTLDWMAVPALLYLTKNLFRKNGTSISIVNDVLQFNQVIKAHRAMYPAGESQHFSLLTPGQRSATPLKPSSEATRTEMLLERKLQLANNRLEESIDHATSQMQQCSNINILGHNISHYETHIKYIAAAYIAWRSLAWLKSERSAALAATLSDIDRSMVVQVTKNIIQHLEHLIALCDEVREEGDITRLKDNFDFTSKNCNEGLIHLAQLIDYEAALKLQGFGKPGHPAQAFGPHGGGAPMGFPR